jgi:hypothetical protein
MWIVKYRWIVNEEFLYNNQKHNKPNPNFKKIKLTKSHDKTLVLESLVVWNQV